MSNFNTMNSGSSENRDNPWVVDSAERDREKTLAERLAESGVDQKILGSQYVKDALRDESSIDSFEVSEDGKKLTLKGKTEYDNRSHDRFYNLDGDKEDKTISLADGGGMTVSEKRLSTHSFARFIRDKSGHVTDEMELAVCNEKRDRKVDLDEDGNVVRYNEVITGTPVITDGSYTLDSINAAWDPTARERAADPDRRVVGLTDYREEIRAEVSHGYADIDRYEWSTEGGCKMSRLNSDYPIGTPKHYHGNYKLSSEDSGYGLGRTIALTDIDMMKQNQAEKEAAEAQKEQEQ